MSGIFYPPSPFLMPAKSGPISLLPLINTYSPVIKKNGKINDLYYQPKTYTEMKKQTIK